MLMEKQRGTVRWAPAGEKEVPVPGTASERVGYVWSLTAETAGLSGKYNVEQRLQRHVVRFVRRKG